MTLKFSTVFISLCLMAQADPAGQPATHGLTQEEISRLPPRHPYRLVRPTREQAVANVRREASMENIAAFLSFLGAAARYNPDGENHRNLQAVAMEIENLPTILGQRISTGRQAFQPIPRSRFDNYDSARVNTLAHILPLLPSPETISVLGGFLSDENDLPEIPTYPPVQTNSDLALVGLKTIGLRDSPPKRTNYPSPADEHADMRNWRGWWRKVKSGALAFSFEGENVEYRFKPDGTWIEGPLGKTTRSDVATHSISGNLRPSKRSESQPEAAGEPPSAPHVENTFGISPWIVALGMVLSGAGIFLWKRAAKN